MREIQTDRIEIEGLMKQACWLLDNEQFGEWLELFAPDGLYEIEVFSPEIQKTMRWQRLGREELTQLLSDIPNHLTEDARRARLIMNIDLNVRDGTASSISRFVVFKTNARGESSTYAVGRYCDELIREAGAWRFKHRKIVLETRMFDVFPHIVPL